MNNLTKVWDKYTPSFFIKIHPCIKDSLNLITLAQQTCILNHIDFNQVSLTSYQDYIRFDRMFISEIVNYLKTYQLLVNKIYTDSMNNSLIQFYGVYHGLNNKDSSDIKFIVASGNTINLVDNVDDVNFLELHSAIEATYKNQSI